LRVKSATKLKASRNGVEEIVGIKTKVVVQKNRVGPPHRTADFDIYFDSGVDDFGGVFQLAKTYKVIKGAGAWTNYTDKLTGEVLKFQGSNGFREERSVGLSKGVPGLCDIYLSNKKGSIKLLPLFYVV